LGLIAHVVIFVGIGLVRGRSGIINAKSNFFKVVGLIHLSNQLERIYPDIGHIVAAGQVEAEASILHRLLIVRRPRHADDKFLQRRSLACGWTLGWIDVETDAATRNLRRT